MACQNSCRASVSTAEQPNKLRKYQLRGSVRALAHHRVNYLRASGCLIEAAGRSRVAPAPVGPDLGEPGVSTLAAAGAGERMMAASLGSTWWQYLVLFLAIAASWAGVPFIGTAALGAAAVAASQRRLDLAAVIVVAATAGEVGGIGGYAIGRRWAGSCWNVPAGTARAGRRSRSGARGCMPGGAGWPCSLPRPSSRARRRCGRTGSPSGTCWTRSGGRCRWRPAPTG